MYNHKRFLNFLVIVTKILSNKFINYFLESLCILKNLIDLN